MNWILSVSMEEDVTCMGLLLVFPGVHPNVLPLPFFHVPIANKGDVWRVRLGVCGRLLWLFF